MLKVFLISLLFLVNFSCIASRYGDNQPNPCQWESDFNKTISSIDPMSNVNSLIIRDNLVKLLAYAVQPLWKQVVKKSSIFNDGRGNYPALWLPVYNQRCIGNVSCAQSYSSSMRLSTFYTFLEIRNFKEILLIKIHSLDHFNINLKKCKSN